MSATMKDWPQAPVTLSYGRLPGRSEWRETVHVRLDEDVEVLWSSAGLHVSMGSWLGGWEGEEPDVVDLDEARRRMHALFRAARVAATIERDGLLRIEGEPEMDTGALREAAERMTHRDGRFDDRMVRG